MSCEGSGKAVLETVQRAVSGVLPYGLCPFDTTLPSGSILWC